MQIPPGFQETAALVCRTVVSGESFSDGDNYEYPQYTKPAEFRGMKVPEILLSGNHGAIAAWRAENAPTKPADD